MPGAKTRPPVSYRLVGIEALVTGIQQMDSPGVGTAVILGREQIAVGRVGIDTGQDGLVALEDFVMQSNTNRRELLRAVDCTGALSGHLMQVVYAAHADGHAQNVAHEFHNATVGAVADQREGQNDLMQPLFGDWKGK